MTKRFEPACDSVTRARAFNRWQATRALLETHQLCSRCFPSGELPDGVTDVIRSTARGGSARALHLAERDCPPNWTVAGQTERPDEYGTPLAYRLKDEDVTEFADLSEVVDGD